MENKNNSLLSNVANATINRNLFSEFDAHIASLNTLQDEAAILLKGASAKQIEAYNQALADMYEVFGPFDLEAA